MAEVAAKQMQELPYYNNFFMTTHVPVIALSAKLAELAPENMNHVFYAGSGSEANDTNIRMVRTYWAEKGKPSKNIIISRHNAYHGSTLGGASLGGMGGMHAQGSLPIPNIHHIDQPNWWAEGGDKTPEEFGLERAQQLEKAILELGEDRIAAFIAEPVQGAGGVIVAPDTYWPEIQRICDKYEILLIADEVICGFGRTGNWFGSQTLGLRPHIMTIAKGLSSGYQPIGGSIVCDEVAEVINACEFNHGYTYSGHPVACAVALKNLEIIEREGLVERVRTDTGPYFAEQLAARIAPHPIVGEVRCIGLMGAIEIVADKETMARFPGDGDAAVTVRDQAIAAGMMMRAVGDTMILSPPLIWTRQTIDMAMDRIIMALDRAAEELRAKG